MNFESTRAVKPEKCQCDLFFSEGGKVRKNVELGGIFHSQLVQEEKWQVSALRAAVCISRLWDMSSLCDPESSPQAVCEFFILQDGKSGML